METLFLNTHWLNKYIQSVRMEDIMKDLVEIRWHGRGGQGAKTAALLLADVAFNTGLYVQGFPVVIGTISSIYIFLYSNDKEEISEAVSASTSSVPCS